MADKVAAPADGPSLETYVETRFNLLIQTITATAKANDDALVAFGLSAKSAAEALAVAYEAARVATDLRYQQRFEAQGDALAAAFLSQQKAMETALQAAKEAVQAALAAADRAVAKAETAADKRFEALNELRQMLNDMVATLITRVEFNTLKERVDRLEGRFDRLDGRTEGTKGTKDDGRSNLALVASFIGILLALLAAVATFLGKHP